MLDSVGEGTFGVVKICLNKTTGAKRAVKIIKNTRFKTQQEQENFINEVKLLQQLDHPGILKLLEVYKDNQQFYFVTELYEGGELFDEIVKRKRFTERDAANIMN
jgi:calcium-dependent protein kinase